MKKILSLFLVCSFLAVGVTANACDGHKKATKASTEVAKTPVTTASTAVTKKADCTPAQKAACTPAQKAACGTEGVKTTSTDATGASKAKSCCPTGAAKKTMAKKS